MPRLPSTTDPELRAHQEWLGYLQPVGLVVAQGLHGKGGKKDAPAAGTAGDKRREAGEDEPTERD